MLADAAGSSKRRRVLAHDRLGPAGANAACVLPARKVVECRGLRAIAFQECSHGTSAARTIAIDGTRSRGVGHRDDSFSSRAAGQRTIAMATSAYPIFSVWGRS